MRPTSAGAVATAVGYFHGSLLASAMLVFETGHDRSAHVSCSVLVPLVVGSQIIL
jgi:hypothetical protein